MSERPKLSELLAQVSAKRTDPLRTHGAQELAFELACQRFAAEFFATYDAVRAYCAVHPGWKCNSRTAKLRAAAYLDKRTRRGARTVAILTEMWRPVEQVGIDVRLLTEWIIEPFTVDLRKFFKSDGQGGIKVYVHRVEDLTDAELRAIKTVKTTVRERTMRDGSFETTTTTHLELRDPYRGIDQAIALLALHHRITQGGDGSQPVAEELSKVIEAAARHRTQFLARLPPSRVREIIDAERAA